MASPVRPLIQPPVHPDAQGAAARAAPSSEARHNLRAITWDGAAFSVMVGAGERYLQAFAVTLGLGDLATGLVATLPWLGGATLQLVSPWAVIWVGSQKRWVVACSALQVVAWIPLAVGALRGSLGAGPLFAAATLYWASGFAAGPAWTAWVETLVPVRLRERFFARRGAVCQAALFLSLVLAGALLHAAEAGGHVMTVFAAIFAASALARTVSTAFLVTQTEPVPLPPDVSPLPLHGFLLRLRTDAPLRLLFCIVPLQFAVQIAEPFFAPYVLRRLHAGYGTYLLLMAAAFLGRIAILPAAGTLARRFGVRRILWAGSLGLVPVAAMWSVAPSFAWLAAVQVFAGLAWGCFELGNFLVYFEAVPHRERTSAITAFFFVNAVAAAGGSLVGGWLLGGLGTGHDGYVALFAVSTVARMIAFQVVAPLRRGGAGSPARPRAA